MSCQVASSFPTLSAEAEAGVAAVSSAEAGARLRFQITPERTTALAEEEARPLSTQALQRHGVPSGWLGLVSIGLLPRQRARKTAPTALLRCSAVRGRAVSVQLAPFRQEGP